MGLAPQQTPQPQQVPQQKIRLDSPALPITVQNTLPLLTTVMLAISVILVAIVSSSQASTYLPYLPWSVSVKDAALVTFIIAALCFGFTAEACTKSQGWDYFALSQERRDFEMLKDTPEYKTFCLGRSKLWYLFAEWAYNVGLFLGALGLVFLLWLAIPLLSTVAFFFLIISVFIRILFQRHLKWGKKIADKLVERFVIKD